MGDSRGSSFLTKWPGLKICDCNTVFRLPTVLFFSLLISEIPKFRQSSFYSIVHSFSLSLALFFFFVDIRNPKVSAILVLFYRSLILSLSRSFFLILSTLIRINADVLSMRYRRCVFLSRRQITTIAD